MTSRARPRPGQDPGKFQCQYGHQCQWRHCGQRGQSMIEYVLVCAAVALVLGIGMVNHQSILWQLIDYFQNSYRNFSYAISLPT